jgi:hypothetical protein
MKRRLFRELRFFVQRIRDAFWYVRRCNASWSDAWKRAGEFR